MKRVSMSFNLSPLTLVSVSVLSLSILSGCSNMNAGFPGATQQAQQPISKKMDPYDSYYGDHRNRLHDTKYQPKIVRTVTKPVFKTNAPKRYVVKKGDTLWGISNKFLNNPSYWPEIWDVNQKVRNPHLIYPGDVLYIYEGGKRTVRVAGSVVEKLVPQMRIERKGSGDPISTLSPFLVWPDVVDQDTINSAPYIVDGRDATLLIEKGQTVYVKNLADRHAGGEYAIFNVGKEIYDPETGQGFGREITYTGFLEIEQAAIHAEVATATVSDSKREIRRGDRLMYVKDQTHTLKTAITIPNRKIRGTIISLFDAQMITGQTQVITINKGAKDGIKLGYTLGVYSPGKVVDDPHERIKKTHFFGLEPAVKVGIPPARSATAIVYKILDNISYAVLTDSHHEVKKGYKIGNP